ncbi:MAG: beta-1,3-glucanase family protein, partial [Dermatophilaceae bacterium]
MARLRLLRRLTAIVLAAATTIGLAALPASPSGAAENSPAVLPITVTNAAGRNDALHLYVLGIDLASGRLGYVDASGTYRPWPAGSLPPSPAPDVSISGASNGGTTTLQIPKNFSGRIYFSYGKKLKLFLTPDGLVQPAPWAGGDENRDILFDWSEFTYNDAGLWLNSSQVDMFAIPHEVSVTGSDGQTRSTGRIVVGGRENVINGLRGTPGWDRTVITRADGTVLRVLAPGKAVGAGLLDGGYLRPYVEDAWNAYTDRALTIQPFADRPEVRFTGRTSGDRMTFTDTSGATVASFTRPSDSSVWGCDGDLPSPNDQVVGPIGRT